MADIIDLDFYRKFRVVLPVYMPESEKTETSIETPLSKPRCKRRFRSTRPYTSKSSTQGEKDSV